MGRKNLDELEADLARLKAKESKIKEELAAQKRAADAKIQKERARKRYQFADAIVAQLGEDVLECVDAFTFYVASHAAEIRQTLNADADSSRFE